MNEQELREEVAAHARLLHARGWVANHDGNVTARLPDGRILATPGARSKGAIRPGDLLIVDREGRILDAPPGGKTFSELGLHLTAYAERPDVSGIVHAHPPSATAFACAGRPLPRATMAEAVVSLGAEIPLVPFASPGPAACAALRLYLAADVFLLESHGTLALGAGVEQAFLRTELVEQLARIALAASVLGGVRSLPDAILPLLLEARSKAGLGAEARAPASAIPVVVACAPPPAGATVATREPGGDELARIIGEEIARALGSDRPR